MSLVEPTLRLFVRRIRAVACAALGAAVLLHVSLPAVAQVTADPSPVVAAPAAESVTPQPGAQTLGQNAPSDAVRATLSQYGSFVQHPKYGEVWSPTVTPPGWHPYEACHWVNSRQYGWYFDDKRPWGAIVHHYGRWTHDAGMGWIWVPDAEWSPGWVVWRTSPQWVGWAPQMPDEDLTTVSADAFNNGGFWTFMDVAHFNEGCAENRVLPAAQTPVVLQQTQFVTEIDQVGGIAIFVLPTYLVGPLVDIDVTFAPWSPAFYVQVVIDFNVIFNDFNVIVVTNFVDCTRPVTSPTLFTPARPPVPPMAPSAPPRAPPGNPPGSPLTMTCADGSTGPCRMPPPPSTSCPRGAHFDGLRCVANLTPYCPDGSVRDSFGRCPLPPAAFRCADGAPPDPATGTCRPAVVQTNCAPPTVLRDGYCTMPRPNVCPDGSPQDANGRCRTPRLVTCTPPNAMIGGICTTPGSAICPNGSPRDGSGQCPIMPVSNCPPPRAMVGGQCVDRVIAQPACLPPRAIVGGQCADRPAMQLACAPPNVMRGNQCVQPLVALPTCQPPMMLRDGRCVGGPVRIDPIDSSEAAIRRSR